MHDVFISYSRRDQEAVEKIRKALSRRGVDVWIDQEDIGTGSRWDLQIEEGIQKSKKVLVILSADSIISSNVSDEWAFALEKGKHLIPVLLEECDVPMRIANLQRIELVPDFDKGISKLVEEVLKNSKTAATKKQGPSFTLPPAFINFFKYAVPLVLVVGGAIFGYNKYFSTVEVQDLIGVSESEAARILKDNNLSIGRVIVDYNEAPEFTVYKSEPAAGAEVKRFSKVDIHVVKEKLRVPNVVGLSRKNAVDTLESMGFAVTVVRSVRHGTNDFGKIISMSLRENDPAYPGTEIAITLADKGGWIFLKDGDQDEILPIPKDFRLRNDTDSTSTDTVIGTLRKGTLVKVVKTHGTGWRLVRVVNPQEV